MKLIKDQLIPNCKVLKRTDNDLIINDNLYNVLNNSSDNEADYFTHIKPFNISLSYHSGIEMIKFVDTQRIQSKLNSKGKIKIDKLIRLYISQN